MDGFAAAQHGTVGDITAGIPLGPWTDALAQKLMQRMSSSGTSRASRASGAKNSAGDCRTVPRVMLRRATLLPYVDYPYVEWYAENGTGGLELDPSQMEIVDMAPKRPENAAELLGDEEERSGRLVASCREWSRSL